MISDQVKSAGCPRCTGKVVVPGKNDLATSNPELVDEWDYLANNPQGITTSTVTAGSGRTVFWICRSCGYKWQSTISNRVYGGNGCPCCAGKAVWSGHNDLATTVPELMKEWDFRKNDRNALRPYEVTRNSNKRAWWICPKGHSWQASINQRTGGHSCPYCCNQRVLTGYNDLASTNPELLREWDYSRNLASGISPCEVTPGNSTKVWWKCVECEHIWLSRINSRTRDKATGCPICGLGLHCKCNSQ